jgi:hypothetical protein
MAKAAELGVPPIDLFRQKFFTWKSGRVEALGESALTEMIRLST